MALREVRLKDDPILRKKSKHVKNINDRTYILLDDMLETMQERNGVGLAAVQIGVLRKIIVIQEELEGEILELINPKVLEMNGKQLGPEACLSVPDKSGYVKRPASIKVEAENRNGEKIIIDGKNRLATILSHEIDHLDGILYIDKLEDIDDEEYYDTLE